MRAIDIKEWSESFGILLENYNKLSTSDCFSKKEVTTEKGVEVFFNHVVGFSIADAITPSEHSLLIEFAFTKAFSTVGEELEKLDGYVKIKKIYKQAADNALEQFMVYTKKETFRITPKQKYAFVVTQQWNEEKMISVHMAITERSMERGLHCLANLKIVAV